MNFNVKEFNSLCNLIYSRVMNESFNRNLITLATNACERCLRYYYDVAIEYDNADRLNRKLFITIGGKAKGKLTFKLIQDGNINFIRVEYVTAGRIYEIKKWAQLRRALDGR